MENFVITRKGSQFLDSPVFRVGGEGAEEAVAVFTCIEAAERYLEESKWQSEFEVGALRPIQLLQWLTVASENGADMIVIDPDRQAQIEGNPQHVIYIGKPLEAFAEVLREDLARVSERGS